MVFIADTILGNIVVKCKEKWGGLCIKLLTVTYFNVELIGNFSFLLCDNLYLVIFKQKTCL